MAEPPNARPGAGAARGLFESVRYLATRLGTRLLVVNLLVVLVPVAGVEFARLYETRLLDSLERDILHQATLVSEFASLEAAAGRPLGDPEQVARLVRAARTTRTRIRLLDAQGVVAGDSHADGPPEGPEPRITTGMTSSSGSGSARPWPLVPERREVREALAGRGPATATRYRARDPGVMLFLALPIRRDGAVIGAVYVVRSTQPVLADLHRIRRGLTRVLSVALLATASVTLLLALSISRPLSRLAASARRIAHGERDVEVKVEGTGELRELGEAIATMTRRLEERVGYARDLAADVAHEFKSPLTSIRGAAELLADGAKDDPDAGPRFLRNIVLDVDRLDRLVTRLLELGRIEASVARPTLVDATSLARAIATRCETPDVSIEVVADGATFVLAREADLETALANVVENAVRFSPPASSVVVRVRAEPDTVVLEVTDRGPGIPQADRERVFERFFTTDTDRNGTGLGLAIARSVARAHGGSIEARAGEDGIGTVVALRLPADARGADKRAQASA